MRRVAYDIEADGFLDDWTDQKYTQVHCIVLRDIDTGEVRCYHEAEHITPRHGGLLDALVVLSQAELRVAHNGLGYDEVVLRELGFKSTKRCFDTLVMSHMLWPEIKHADKALRKHRARTGGAEFPSDMIGRHSLESWGHRFGVFKGAFSEFAVFTQEMLDYCIQDTAITVLLFKHEQEKISAVGHSQRSIDIEHKFAEVLARQMRAGIHFDQEGAEALWREWEGELIQIDERLTAGVEPWVEHYVTPKRKIAKTRVKQFNPNSRLQVARLYEERYGHKFSEETEGGGWAINEGVLKSLTLRKLPFAEDIERRFLLQKRISTLATTEKGLSWIAAVKSDGRVHPYINHHGTVTSRCSHSRFNISGVPRNSSPYGRECRALFTATPGWIMVGGDAKGLELRMFAHFLHPYDGGQYAETVLQGDPHSVHQSYFGFVDDDSMSGRDRTKTAFYAWLYGGGSEKLGRISVDGIKYVTQPQAIRLGKDLVAHLETRWPGLLDLKKALNIHLTGMSHPKFRTPLIRPWVRSLDGRVLKCRSQHSSLNLAFQGGGAVVMKLATILADEYIQKQGPVWREDYMFVIHAHDELQADCRTQAVADIVQEAIEWAIPEAGRQLNLKVALAADVQQGTNWSETH